MLIKDLLAYGKKEFETAGLDSAYLDALLLLSRCAGVAKESLLASLGDPAGSELVDCFREKVARRLGGSSVAYILKRREFYALDFYVDERVLVPRPDTEILVETTAATATRLAAEISGDAGDAERTGARRLRIHDACTGSGCVAIALAADRGWDVSASDISPAALEVFAANSTRLLGRILPHWRSDLLTNVPGTYHIICANPPYVPTPLARELSAGREPLLALDGGSDGLDPARRLIAEALESLEPNGYLLLEAADDQMERLERLLLSYDYSDVAVARDLAGLKRVIKGRRRG